MVDKSIVAMVYQLIAGGAPPVLQPRSMCSMFWPGKASFGALGSLEISVPSLGKVRHENSHGMRK